MQEVSITWSISKQSVTVWNPTNGTVLMQYRNEKPT
eukprot:gene24810-10728_t